MKPSLIPQPPLSNKAKFPNVLNNFQSHSRNHSLKKIAYYQGSNINQAHSLNSLGMFPKIQQKAKKHHVINKNNGETSLQKNSIKWHLPNNHLKKRQKLLTQANIGSQQLIAGDQSFVSLTNKLMATQGDIKDTMIDFKKKIQLNKLFIKKEIQRKNKQNQSSIKKEGTQWVKKKRVASSRFVPVQSTSNLDSRVHNNPDSRVHNNPDSRVHNNLKDWQLSINNNNKKRTIQTPKNKLQSSIIKQKNNSSSKKKKKRMSSNNHNNNNFNLLQQRKRQKTQVQESVLIKENKTQHRLQKQRSLRSLSKRKSEGLFGDLQVMLDQKIRGDNKQGYQKMKGDKQGYRQKQYQTQKYVEEENKLRELLNKLYKHKSLSNNIDQYHSNRHHSTQSFHLNTHNHHHSASGQLLILQESVDNLDSSMTSCDKGKVTKEQQTHHGWNRLELESSSQITYRKSSFQHQLNKISEYAQRNDASLQKYIGMRKQLMKLGFQVQSIKQQDTNHNNRLNEKKNTKHYK